MVASSFLSQLFSPFLALVPTPLVSHVALYSFVRQRRLRILVLLIGLAAWALCTFGADLGLFSAALRYEHGAIVIRSPVVDFPPLTTPVYFFVAVSAMLILLGGLKAERFVR